LIQIFETDDGSTSLFHESLKETYHSRQGAYSESMHVYIQHGLHSLQPYAGTIRVFELGFGTGLNAYLLLEEVLQTPGLVMEYTGLEPSPLPEHLLSQIHFKGYRTDDFMALHQSNESPFNLASGRFTGKVLKQTLEDFLPEKAFDLIFYDAFAPTVQPELWSEATLARIVEMMRPNAVWVSYCAKGSVRRCLQNLGLQVFRMPGALTKKHMLRAIKV